MPRLPPVEKLPLAARKNLRDAWEAKKGDLEKKLSEILETPWTMEADIHQIYAYATDGYAKESPGGYLHEYFDGANRRLEEFIEYYKEEALKEINEELCPKHIICLDVDETETVQYNGVDVHDGKLRILFDAKNMSSNISSALDRDKLLNALSKAPSTKPMSFKARLFTKREYEPKTKEASEKIAELLGKPLTLTPNFEENFAKLQAYSKEKKTKLNYDWERSFPNLTALYWKGLASQLDWQKFGDDDMLQEGFFDVVDKAEVSLKVVDEIKRSYNEFAIEDGVLVIKTTPDNWGTNVDAAGEKLVDAL